MAAATLSLKEVEHQLGQVLDKYRDDMVIAPRPVAFYTQATWVGPATVTIRGHQFRVWQVGSVLHLREALIQRAGEIPLILTTLNENQIPQDSRARLLRYRLFSVDPWEVVKSLFGAHTLDPRLRDRPLAEALILHAPSDGYPPVPAGFLDADAAWRALCRSALGMGPRPPEGRDLLRWAASLEAQLKYVEADESFRHMARSQLESHLGQLARPVLSALDEGRGQDVMTFALLCDGLDHYWEEDPRGAELVAARAEYLVGNQPLTRVDIQTVAAALRSLADEPGGVELVEGFTSAFDSLLVGLRAEQIAGASPWSSIGFDRNLARLARELDKPAVDVSLARDYLHTLARSHGGVRHEALLRRCNTLVQLATWLQEGQAHVGGDLTSSARLYLTDGMWVDRAREEVVATDLQGELGPVARRLLERVYQRRSMLNESFARHLVEDLRSQTLPEGVIPIHEVLGRLVVPQVALDPVLLVVLDGMSWPVAISLLDDLHTAHWEGYGDTPQPPVVVATIPSVTEFSRTSLLCGVQTSGQASSEKVGFRSFAPLVQLSRPGVPPRLFHKHELAADGRGGLAEEVRAVVAGGECRVVAVVVNAVDDRLGGPQQLDSRWQLDNITPLRSLLDAAEQGKRRVIFTSDHGHVWEESSTRVMSGEADRWRSAQTPPGPGELLVSGPMVQKLTSLPEIVAPWGERIRYNMPRAGYHGGLTPQEVLVPFVVALPRQHEAQGVVPLGLNPPPWWREPNAPPAGNSRIPWPSPLPPVAPPRVEARPPEGTPLLERLLTSPLFQDQKKSLGRHNPDDDKLRTLLGPLIQRGGQAHVRILAAGLGLPDYRLFALITQVGRLLNLDGYNTLSLDQAENVVRLDLAQLRLQFDLKGD